jgi:hypothetical protein
MTSHKRREQIKLPHPFDASALMQYLERVPHDATVTITTRYGGSQRDPHPIEYVINAEYWGE